MLKKVIIVSLTVISSLLYSELLPADVVLLKGGGIMQGEVLSETDKSIEFKNPSGTIEKINKELVVSVVKREEKLPLIPEEVYLDKVKSVSPKDAKAHYELGLFCFKNSLLDYALKEFEQAKNINSEYEDLVLKYIKYIASVKEKAEKMTDKQVKEEDTPPLTLTMVTQELKKDDLPIPHNYKDTKPIVKAINDLNNNELKQEYAQRYLELGSYLEKAKISRPAVDEYKTSQATLFCYKMAYYLAQSPQTKNLAQQKTMSFRKYSEEKKKEKLLIPYSRSDRDAIILFIRGLGSDAEKKWYFGGYYGMGDKFEAKVGDYATPLKEEDRRNLKIALHCYEITKSAYTRNILSSGIIEAKIQECKERLGKE